MKKQIVELLINKEKLTKKCENMSEEIDNLKQQNLRLTEINMKQKRDLKDLKLKLDSFKSEFNNKIYKDMVQYKQKMNNDIIKLMKIIKEIKCNKNNMICEYNKEIKLRRK